jgi:hypothetical protein
MAAETPESPNLYELGDSYGDTQITYSTSSLAGPPQLSYSGPKGEHSFSGEEIATLASALGTEVTVTLEVVPDLHTLTLTLVLPGVAIAFGEEHAFATIGVFTTTATTIAGPPPGPAQTYEVIALAGVAKLVAF